MKLLKILLWIVGLVVLGVIALLAYVSFALPNVGDPPDMTIEINPERVKRGDYLANSVAVCMDCHSERDWTVFAAPPKPGTKGAGGDIFDQNMGFPGRFVSSNITPGRLKDWTDGEIFRAITTGVSKDGSAIFPVMPYHKYGQLDEEDIKSIIAYLRTIEPSSKQIEDSDPDFPMNFIINTIPREAKLQPMPTDKKSLEYGKYVITAAACYDCHTKMEKGQFIGKDYAGGNSFILPTGDTCRAPNLTPHATGIGGWSEDMFVQRFKLYTDSNYVQQKVKKGDYQTIMPWLMYARMKDEDLKAIYRYLMSIEPVENDVMPFTASKN